MRKGLLAGPMLLACACAGAQKSLLALDELAKSTTASAQDATALPESVQSWREDALNHEHGNGVPRDLTLAAQIYCRAARHGDAEASSAWRGWP